MTFFTPYYLNSMLLISNLMTSAAAISPKSFTSIVTPWPLAFNEAAITSEKTEGVKPSDPLPVLM